MSEPIAFDGPMIRTTDLRKTFRTKRADGRGRSRRRPRGRPRGDLRLPRPERGRQDHDAADARHAASARRSGEAWIAGVDLARDPAEVRRRIGYVPQGGSTDPAETGRGELVLQARLYGSSAGEARARAAEVLEMLELSGSADRAISTYFGRHEAPARRRPRDRPSSARAVPRRAHDRARPAGSRADVGRGPPAPRARGRRCS